MFKNLRELAANMNDEAKCREYLAKQRWPDGIVICPHCGHNKSYVIENGKKYKCGSKTCYKKFSVKVGTIFEASNIPLTKWFVAVYLCTAHKKGVSSYQLGRDIGVSQKCAWFMLHRIREMMRPKQEVILDNIVEVDSSYIGGKTSNMNKFRRKQLKESGKPPIETKTMVVGMIERGGNLKLVPGGRGFESVSSVHPVVYNNIDKDAVLITDNSGCYSGLKKDFAGHETVNHANNEYVRDGVIHTNTIEGAFSHLKRSIFGVYHKVTIKHLSRYCEETAFRYNLRKMKDADRFTVALQLTPGRLDWKTLIAAPAPKIEITVETPVVKLEKIGKGIGVLQYKNGQLVAQYASIVDAARINNLYASQISRVLDGRRKSAGGYEWKYA